MSKSVFGPAKKGRTKTVSVTFRITEPMAQAVLAVMAKHPIEFSHASDFFRLAMKAELQRRGLME